MNRTCPVALVFAIVGAILAQASFGQNNQRGLAGGATAASAAAKDGTLQPLAARIGHTDPARFGSGRSHGSEGDMHCMTGSELKP